MKASTSTEKSATTAQKKGGGLQDIAGMTELKLLITESFINVLKNKECAEKFGIKRQTAMGLVKKLEQAGVNPVTLTNACEYERLENLRHILKK